MTQAVGVEALADLSRARRRHFVENIDFINAIYKAYIVGAALLVGGSILVGFAQSAPLGSQAQRSLVHYGPAVVGLFYGLAIFAGFRSGSKGGPLALQGADVRMILLSSVPRARFLRTRAMSQVKSFVPGALLIGGLVGGVAHRALGQPTARPVVESSLMALVIVVAFFGTGYLTSGLQLNKWIATAVGLVFVAWPLGDLYEGTETFPGGRLAYPLFHQSGFSLALLAALGAGVLFVLGILLISGLSLEMLDRRARLIGTLRFAATTRDIRSVILLRRQLSGEKARSGRTVVSGIGFGDSSTAVIAKRSLESILRWPIERVLRFLVLALIAGLSAREMWAGSLLPLGVATVALFIGATDLLEPLSQVADHPDGIVHVGIPLWRVESRLLLVPFIGMVIFVLLGTLASLPFANSTVAVHLGLISAVPLAASSTTGAAVAILRKRGSAGSTLLMPEVVAITSVIVELIPFIIVGSGFIAIVNSYNLHDLNRALVDTTAISAASFSLLLPLAAWTWIRRRNEFTTAKI